MTLPAPPRKPRAKAAAPAKATRARASNPAAPAPTDDPATAYALSVVSGEAAAGPHVRGACERHLADLEAGVWTWDVAAASRVIRYFATVLVLGGGEHEGKPFILLPWQEFVVGSLFGWKGPDGLRRFRTAYIESGKGSGKSPLAAGIGMYMLTADDEPRAEVYACASKLDQAQILFRDAVAMFDQSPWLNARLKPTGGKGKEWNLAHVKSSSWFRTVASEDGQSGFRPHCALLDEIHEHHNDNAVKLMRAGTKGRRQALIFMITNSGHDRTGVCWNYHEYAVSICAGVKVDDAFFAYVCALDSERTETLSACETVRHMQRICTCPNAPDAQTLTCLHEACAALATSGPTEKPVVPGAGVRTTRTDLSRGVAFADCAMTSKSASQTPPERPQSAQVNNGGTKRTRTISGSIKRNGSLLSPDTEANSRECNAYENTVCPQGLHTPGLSRPRADFVKSVANPTQDYASTIATSLGFIEDCCASSVTPGLDFSATVQKIYAAHSPTCEVAKNNLDDRGRMTVRLPADDPFESEACWAKANPSLGYTFGLKYIRELVTQARGMPSSEAVVRRLNFCQWTDAESPWIDVDLWNKCESDFDPADYAHLPCYGGLDLSQKRDLTAFSATWVHPDGRKSSASWFWTPGDTLAERSRTDNVPYALWKEQGHLFAPPGRMIDKRHVATFVQKFAQTNQLETLAYDQAQADDFLTACNDIGFDVWIEDREPNDNGTYDEPPGVGLRMVRHGQGFSGFNSKKTMWMNRSITALEDAIVNGMLEVQRSPVLRYCSASAVIEADASNNRKWNKQKATGRMDGMISLSESVGAASIGAPPKRVSIWDRPELFNEFD